MERLREQIEEYLRNNRTVVFGYLFGSFANGTYNSRSDVDIALYMKDLSFDNKLQINYELSKLLKKDVDLIVLNEVKNIYLLEDILSHSIVIKEDNLRLDFELVKQHDILDYKEFKRMISAA